MEDSSTYSSLPRCAVVRYRREGNKVHWTPCGPPASAVAARVKNFEDAFALEEFSSQALDSKRSYPIRLPTGGEVPHAVSKSNRFGWFGWKRTTPRKRSNFGSSVSERVLKDVEVGPRKMRSLKYGGRRQRSCGVGWSPEPSVRSSKSSTYGVESDRSGYVMYKYDERREVEESVSEDEDQVESILYRSWQSIRRQLKKLTARNRREFDFDAPRFEDDNRYHCRQAYAY